MKRIHLLIGLLIFSFSAYSQAPTISSFSPDSGAVGRLVTIKGTNLSSSTSFTIGGTAATIISNTDSTLVGMVMPGASTGTVAVSTAAGNAAAGSNFTIIRTGYPSSQKSPKLVGIGSIGLSDQGISVALSADGNTAIVGGFGDTDSTGAAWIYTRGDSSWRQQGSKLVGTGAVGYAQQGYSVALSADGNTAVVGGNNDNGGIGAVWIFTRSDTTWTQQGSKLVGSGWVSQSDQGRSVAISADGNTVLVGGDGDNSIPYSGSDGPGAVWVFTRSGGSWTQQGGKLVGQYGSAAGQGCAVALSADGNTAIVGGAADSGGVGAVWIYTRSGSVWSQQVAKLTGTGAVGNYIYEGRSVAISADGNTAIIGGYDDNNGIGAAWVFTRSGSTWTQQGNKLVGTGGDGNQGWSVGLSADGNTAIVGGFLDVNLGGFSGATWVFRRAGNVWTQQGGKMIGTGATGSSEQGSSLSLSADGYTALIGGIRDNNDVGAAWVFVADTVNAPYCLPTSSYIIRGICPGDTFVLGGHLHFAAGSYTDTLVNNSGCDSIVTLQLVLLDSSSAYFSLQPSDSSHVWYIILPFAGNNITYTWHWGDSTSSIGDTVSHTYSSAGYYNICLTVSDSGGCFATYCDTSVYLFKDQSQMVYVKVVHYPTGISEINSTSSFIHLYPNPNKGSFTLRTSGSIGSDYSICDMLGNVIAQQTIRTDSQQIDLAEAQAGVYIISIKGLSPIRFLILR